jgi:hypothetical protein
MGITCLDPEQSEETTMTNSRPTPSVVADEELVERVRDAMISTCLLVGSDLTIDNVEELARAALAAMKGSDHGSR